MSDVSFGVFTFIHPNAAFLAAPEKAIQNRSGGPCIAYWLSQQIGAEFFYDEEIADKRFDVLCINGLSLTSDKVRDAIARAVRRAKRVVWIQNDYTIMPPRADGHAESPFRYAFRVRRQKGKPDVDYWTILMTLVKNRGDFLVNWNMLSARETPLAIRSPDDCDLFYYGSFRPHRRAAFDQFFGGKHRKLRRVISNISRNGFSMYDDVTVIPKITSRFYRELNSHGFGLYIEDVSRWRTAHLPANRFFEMLSAGLPILFEPDCRTTMRNGGYSIKDFTVRNPRDIIALMPERGAIAKEQRDRWWEPFRVKLAKRVHEVVRQYTHRCL